MGGGLGYFLYILLLFYVFNIFSFFSLLLILCSCAGIDYLLLLLWIGDLHQGEGFSCDRGDSVSADLDLVS